MNDKMSQQTHSKESTMIGYIKITFKGSSPCPQEENVWSLGPVPCSFELLIIYNYMSNVLSHKKHWEAQIVFSSSGYLEVIGSTFPGWQVHLVIFILDIFPIISHY